MKKLLKNTQKTIALLAFVLTVSNTVVAQPGIKGAGNITGTNVDLNNRTYLTANVNSGATSITVNSSSMIGGNFATGLSAGDLILIIQMQGASINIVNNSSFGAINSYNNVGMYEFRCVASVPNSTTINVTVPLSNNYTSSGHVQIVRIPRYTSFNLNGGNSVRPSAWDGNTGGITAIEISGNAIINGTITATGRGFRGGSFENQSQSASSNVNDWYSNDDEDGGNKGESIAGYEANEYQALGVRYSRGAIANGGGGGNAHNAGGGGGANAGVVANWNGRGNPDNSGLNYSLAWNLEGGSFSSNTSSGGGRGGYTYGSDNRNAMLTAPGNGSWGGNNRRNYGGYGGRPLDYSTGRIYMGGGGGAGDGNNNAASGGANGGGIVFIICYGNITGTGFIESNGANAANTSSGHNDAPGGGGGGGTIILSASGSISNSLNLYANGGNGGNQLISGNESEGPGGGGGGGYIAVSSGSPNRFANGGSNGTSTSSAITEFTPNGATRGGVGTPNATYNSSTAVAMDAANAGGDMNFCTSAILNADSPENTIGIWSIISGTDGVLVDPTDPNTVFMGDSAQMYLLEWTLTNNICQSSRDTIVINPICMPLPVELLSFNGEMVDGKVFLSWSATKMEDFRYFVIERKIGNGQWTDLTTVNPMNDNSPIQYYSSIDQNPGQEYVNYRLRLVDLNYSYEYSNVIGFGKNDNKNVVAYPVPAGDKLTLNGSVLKGSNVTIVNSIGLEMEVETEYSNDFVEIDLSKLPYGCYFYKVIKNGQLILGKTFIREIR